jgi:hypothetical protein
VERRLDIHVGMQDDVDRIEPAATRLARRVRDQEAGMIERMRRLPLRDAVFAYLHHWATHHGDDRYITARRLTEILSGVDAVDLTAARLEARALLDDAYRYGDEWHSRRERAARGDADVHERDLEAEMRRDHPGFSDETYSAAMHRGLFLAR